jgi:SAM-dependent methyltransferase
MSEDCVLADEPQRQAENQELYGLPEYCDIAFSWDLTRDIEIFRRFFRRLVPFEVRSVLEPACGTGRFLVALPKHGFRVTGYDRSPEMLAYARQRILQAGAQQMASAVEGDMRTFRSPRAFDAAINSINSIGYLLTDEDIVDHFRNTATSLRLGGIYVVHLACAWDNLEPHEAEGWVMERDGTRVRTVWDIERQDFEARLSFQVCRMEVDDHGRKQHFEFSDVQRLWLQDDFSRLVRESGKLRLEAVCDEEQRAIPLDTRITGEMGNLFYALKVL